MRRLIATLMLALTGLLSTAVPALAADESAGGGFGSGQWDGLLLALVLGVLLGLLLFVDAYGGDDTDEHGDGGH